MLQTSSSSLGLEHKLKKKKGKKAKKPFLLSK